jgi:hypothetical protein
MPVHHKSMVKVVQELFFALEVYKGKCRRKININVTDIRWNSWFNWRRWEPTSQFSTDSELNAGNAITGLFQVLANVRVSSKAELFTLISVPFTQITSRIPSKFPTRQQSQISNVLKRYVAGSCSLVHDWQYDIISGPMFAFLFTKTIASSERDQLTFNSEEDPVSSLIRNSLRVRLLRWEHGF